MNLKKIRLLTKRQKIIVVCVILSVGLLSTQLVPFYLTYRFIIGLAALSYILSLWALLEGINKLKAVVLLILPTLFTLAVASFYFLLPIRWLTRLPVALVFGVTYYTLLLSQNVFNVASIRTIPLYRAATTTVFVLTLLTAYLLLNVLFSLNLLFIWNALAVAVLSFLLIIQVIWSIEMEGISASVLVYALSLSLIMGELGMALSFWPISNAMTSLVISTALFILMGVSSQQLRERLSRGIVWEYLGWGGVVLLVTLLSASWAG